MRKLLIPFSLLLVLSAVHAEELDEAQTSAYLKQLSSARSNQSFAADFSEVKTLAVMQKPIRESGRISFLPPDKFRREVTSKPASMTICDGETLWLYYPEFREVEKYTLAKNRALRESLSAMTSGLRLDNLEKLFSVSLSKVKDGHQLVLTPRSSALRKVVTRLTLLIAPDFVPRRMEILGVEGDRTVTTFANERAEKLSAKDFQFQPPAGVSVSEPLGR